MLSSVLIFAFVYILLATEVVEKSTAALSGGVAVVLLGLVSFDDIAGVGAANPLIDLNVIFLLIGMMVSVAVLAETGFFEFMAIYLAKKAKGRPIPILLLLLVLTMLFSALLDNVTTIILLAPVTILITQLLELPTKLFLILEAIASNIGGTATLIGDPPNIIIASKVQLSFTDFLVHLGPAVLVISLCFLLTLYVFYKDKLKVPEHVKMRVLNSYPELAIRDLKKLKRALAVFGMIFLAFFLHHHFHIPPGIVALGGMTLMLIVCKSDSEEMFKQVEWDAILFFIGLFIMIGALEKNGAIDHLAEYMLSFCGDSLLLSAMIILIASAVFSAILDNIPFVIAMTPLVQKLVAEVDPSFHTGAGLPVGPHVLFWALALGACLGGNGTIIGASANVVAVKIGERNGCKIGFFEFMKYGSFFMLQSVIVAALYVWLRYF